MKGIKILTQKERVIEKLYESIKNNRIVLTYSFVSTFIFGLIAHAYGIFNNTLSFDSLVEFYSGDFLGTENIHKVALGRWFVPFYRKVFNVGIIEPWPQFLFACLWVSIAVALIIKIFRLTNRVNYILISAIMVTNITITAQTATYIFEIDANMFCMMLSVLSVFFWARYNRLRYSFISVVLLVLTLSIYQSYISVAITLAIVFCIIGFLNNSKARDIMFKGIKYIGIIILAAIIYCLMTIIMLRAFHTESLTNTYNSFDSSRFLNNLIYSLFGVYKNCIGNIIVPETLSSKLAFGIVSLVPFVSIGVTLCHFIRKKKLTIANIIWSIVLIIILPLGMDISYIISGGMVHELMQYAFSLSWVFMIIMWEAVLAKEGYRFSIALKNIAFVMIAIIILNNILVSNGIYVEKKIQENATLSQMTNVMGDIKAYEGFDIDNTKVVIIGNSTSFNNSELYSSINTITGFEPTITYDATKPAYFKYVLNFPAKIIVPSELSQSEENMIQSMPSYPRNGYIKKINEYLVVKLSDT